MTEKGRTADSAAKRPADRAQRTAHRHTGEPRVSLPARATGDGWRYPEGDDSAIVRGED
ncbi:hypothetical protein SAMN05216499_114128 [Actinacidiphila paucisporea]|uniref:Uncharacterized protein n=1 Tax=Actinacidiphila paucisporea TaxID=310782 RepID=A0A1M7LR71_9ACTN|nr:hypothetical protein SAMN05216499_114128 [Actinacidiphila paucisporea]